MNLNSYIKKKNEKKSLKKFKIKTYRTKPIINIDNIYITFFITTMFKKIVKRSLEPSEILEKKPLKLSEIPEKRLKLMPINKSNSKELQDDEVLNEELQEIDEVPVTVDTFLLHSSNVLPVIADRCNAISDQKSSEKLQKKCEDLQNNEEQQDNEELQKMDKVPVTVDTFLVGSSNVLPVVADGCNAISDQRSSKKSQKMKT